MASKTQGRFDGMLAHAFLWPIKWFFVIVFIYLFLGFLGIFAAMIWSHFVWANPVAASEALLATESSRAFSMNDVSNLARFTMEWTYWLFFRFTTIHDAMQATLAGYQTNQFDHLFLKVFIENNTNRIYVAMNMNRVFGLRIAYLLSSAPIFALMHAVAHVDGLTERYIRRACAGRESADLNRLGKIAKLMFFASGATIYLCLPVAIDPFWFIGPLLVVYTVGTRIQWQFYKKYL